MSGRLAAAGSVVLDANGAGTVELGPRTSSENWRILRLTTQGNSTTVPVLRVHRGAVSGPMVDTTQLGNADVSETQLDFFAGEYLTASYTGGTPGARQTFYVEGVTF